MPLKKNISHECKDTNPFTVFKALLGNDLHLSRIRLISLFITALCKVKSVNFVKVSAGFASPSLASSCLRRIQRFMAEAELPMKIVSLLIFSILPISGRLILVMDRTNWKFGQKNINILMLGVSYRNIAIPLMFRMLDKQGNSSTAERISLMRDFMDWFGRDSIDCLLADREFVGVKRLAPRPKYMQAAAVAAAVVLVLSIGYVLRRQAMDAPLVIGDCTGVNDRMEIPPSEFACTILGSHFPAADIGASYRGTIAEMGNIVVDKAADGIVRLGYRPHGHLPDSGVRYIAITTGARQQCALELPDGTRIRLNAGSAVHYSLAPKPGQPPTLRFIGEAWVQLPPVAEARRSPFAIETSESRLLADEGEFVVRTDPGRTSVILLAGRMAVESLASGQVQPMDCPGDMAIASRAPGQGQGTLRFVRDGPTDAALSWTKAKRTYKNVPLRQFVLEASRWHGFKVQDINCIPADRRINATLCYRAPNNELFAAIKAAGVTMYEKEGMLVFCPGTLERGGARRTVM